MDIVCIGEGMIELSEPPLRRGYGGDTLNTAVYLARLLGDRAGVRYATALGTDALSDELLQAWQAEGVLTDEVQRYPGGKPGLYMIRTDEHGERSFHYWRSDSAARDYLRERADFDALLRRRAYHAAYLSGITLALCSQAQREALFTALRALRERGGKVWFDNNYRPLLWPQGGAAAAFDTALECADVALLTEDDHAAVYGPADVDAVVDHARRRGVDEVVVKRGSQPSVVATASAEHQVASEIVDHVVDTSAAGDSFAAGYLSARLLGGDLQCSVRWGHRLAARVIGHRGAIIPAAVMPKMPLVGNASPRQSCL